MSETELQASILKALTQAGYWAFRVNSGGRIGRTKLAPAGTPDICLVSPAGWLEVKLPGEGLNPKQKDWHAKAQCKGVRVTTVDSVAAALASAGDWTKQDAMREGVAFELRRIVEAM